MESWKRHGKLNIHCSTMGRIAHKFITTGWDQDGYKRFQINGKKYYVHRLIMETFDPVGEIITMYMSNHQPQVDHINKCKTDNRLENLEWVTPQENSRRATTYQSHFSSDKIVGENT